MVYLRKKGQQSKFQMNWPVKAFNVFFFACVIVNKQVNRLKDYSNFLKKNFPYFFRLLRSACYEHLWLVNFDEIRFLLEKFGLLSTECCHKLYWQTKKKKRRLRVVRPKRILTQANIGHIFLKRRMATEKDHNDNNPTPEWPQDQPSSSRNPNLILSRKPWPKESRVTVCLGHSVWG